MKSKSVRLVSLACALGGVAILMTACGTTSGYKQADKTGAGIAEFRDEIVNGKKAVDATMKSLSTIAATANTDPRKAYEQFSKDVTNLESTAAQIRKRSKSIQAQGQAYFKQWEMELAQVKNPEVRKLADQRKAALQKTFETIRQQSEPMNAKFDPWMADLKDLKVYLGNDLTIAGVDSAKSLFSKTTREGLEVQESMDALVAELNTVEATITPAKAAPAK